MQIVIRADASQLIGTGHVMRCLALADGARQKGWSVCFVMRSPTDRILDLVRSAGHGIRILRSRIFPNNPLQGAISHSHWLSVPQEIDANETCIAVEELAADWVIVDHYALDATWHSIVKNKCQKILVIDDLCDRNLDCLLLVDQNLGAEEQRYREKLISASDCLFGPKYALLRSEFQEWRALSLRRKKSREIRNVLISMGGVDAANTTLSALRTLEESTLAQQCQFSAVLGAENSYQSEMSDFVKDSKISIEVRFAITNMAEMMSWADLCIGAGGTTSLERCCLGLPTLTFAIAQNQEHVVEILERHGLAYRSELETLRSDFDRLIGGEDRTSLNQMKDKMPAVCDGRGVARVVDQMERL